MNLRITISTASLVLGGLLTACAVDGTADLEVRGDLIEARVAVPPSQEWVPGRVEPRQLHPADIDFLFTLTTKGWAPDTSLVWGVGEGRVLWIYRVHDRDRPGFLDKLAEGLDVIGPPIDRGQNGTGVHKGPLPPPPDPDPVGQPEFTDEYIRNVLDLADIQQQVFEAHVGGF